MATMMVLLSVGVTGLAWVWHTRPRHRRAVVGIAAAGGLSFQLVHALEHVVQAGAWVAAPNQPPFLTPWAIVGRDALAFGGDATLGNELLHLLGNVVFLVGLLALAWIVRSTATMTRALRAALVVQGAHVAEHVALSVTATLAARPIGVTTLLGMLDAGPTLWTLRVVAHFILNAVATVAAVLAILRWVQTAEARPHLLQPSR